MIDERIMYIKTLNSFPVLVAMYPTNDHTPPNLELTPEDGAFTKEEFLKQKPFLTSPLVREVALDAGWLHAGVINY